MNDEGGNPKRQRTAALQNLSDVAKPCGVWQPSAALDCASSLDLFCHCACPALLMTAPIWSVNASWNPTRSRSRLISVSVTVYQADAFCADGFLGNPAGVCVLKAPEPDGWMQNVAEKMNLSETAFLKRRENDEFHLRWFTPKAEVKLCGHGRP